MQIQGELTRDYKKTYSGTLQSALLIAKEDGLVSLWRGLNAGLAYQVVMNGTRLTLFDFMKDHGHGFILNNVIIGFLLYNSWVIL